MKELPAPFFHRDAVIVAKELLGKVISINGCSARIVETEAYGRDKASHAYTKTPRSQIMFNTYAHVYIYFVYGMYHCLNFTTNPQGEAGAVLIRALEPLSGIEKMKKRRGTDKVGNLCSGPGKLCLALGLSKENNGKPLGQEMKVFDDGCKVERIGKSSRIGIKDALNLQWRFFIEENEWVSK